MSITSTVNRKALRDFGLLLGLFTLIWGVFIPLIKQHSLPYWPWFITLPLWTLSILSPSSLRLIYVGWMKVGLVLGLINTRIVLGIIFYGIAFPLGYMMRLKGYDPLTLSLGSDNESYRVKVPQKSINHIENLY